MGTSPTIGIDLGTTNSLCAVFKNGQPVLVPNAINELLTPSVVGVLEDGQIVVGQAARELRVTSPDRTVSCFKRSMGSSTQLKIGDRKFNSVELSSFMLRSLIEDAQKSLGEDVSNAVITVPAYFNDNQRKATQLAGRVAGLSSSRIINEPTAAALTYGFHDRTAERKLIVIDLGGGTFDVTVMDIFEGTLEIIATAGETMLGGEDFTSRLVGWVLLQCNLQYESEEIKNPLRVSRLRQLCEYAKRQLNEQSTVSIRIPSEKGTLDDHAKVVELTRKVAAEQYGPLIRRLSRPISQAIRDSKLQLSDISEVILVGGATRMVEVQQFVRKLLGKEPQVKFNPDHVVALGAAVQAALIADDQAVEDMVMTDVCPFTLGVEIAKEFGSKQVTGYYLPIIHRNTTIPVSKEELVATTLPNQREVLVKVFQGESRKVAENLFLGELKVKNIPPGAAGQFIHLRFTYDLNGILEVEAYLPDSGTKFAAVLTNHAQGMTDVQIRAAVARMQAIKFYPRENIENQRLLLFAERAIGEISSFQRLELEEMVDSFEAAMESGDPEFFDAVREALLLKLSSLGFDPQGLSDEQ